MKAFKIGIAAVVILLVVPGIDFGIAHAGGSDWNLEALDSYFEYVPENRPVLSFEDQEGRQMAASTPEGMQLQSPIETGSLPSGSDAESSIFEAGGLIFRGGIDTGP